MQFVLSACKQLSRVQKPMSTVSRLNHHIVSYPFKKVAALQQFVDGCNQGITRQFGTHVGIKLEQGTVIGRDETLPNGKPYQYFRGIPYAEPPVGELRFQPPVPLKSFASPEIDCSKEGDVSLQRDPFTGVVQGSENCLFLNVYAPKCQTNTQLPVMVFIHGGAFMFGSGSGILYTPLYLVQQDVVVVTLNYRLGALGLLVLPEADIAGNMALKDQQLALHWVKENIGQFGGDQNNVTLFGESSGGSCAHFHLLSESSKKLFHKAILQSGMANMAWAQMNGASVKIKKLVKLMGCDSNDPLEIAKYLKNYENVNDFVMRLPKILEKEEVRRAISVPVAPVVETPSPHAIVTELPLIAMKKPNTIDIPVMMGYTSGEGIQFLARIGKRLESVDKDLARFAPPSFNLGPDDPRSLELAQKIRDFYFQGDTVDEKNLNSLADAYTDLHFLIDSYVAAELHSRNQPKSPLYFYRFDYTGALNMLKQTLGFSRLRGVCHADELFYIFQADAAKEPWNERDKRMVEKMCKLWTNFAKHGNPTPDKDDRFVDCPWEAVRKIADNEKFNLNAFIIDENQRMLENPDGSRVKFWRDVYKTFGKQLQPKM